MNVSACMCDVMRTCVITLHPAMTFRYPHEGLFVAERRDDVALEGDHTLDDLLIGVLGRDQRHDVAALHRVTVHRPARQEHIVGGDARVRIEGGLHRYACSEMGVEITVL